jgi:hypothetical protein
VATKKEREQVLSTPPGIELDFLVAQHVMGTDPSFQAPLWSQSKAEADFVLSMIRRLWPRQKERRFLDNFGLCISRRFGGGKISPELWILHYLPEDVARAAVLTCMEQP